MADEIRSYFKEEAQELIDRLTAGAAALDAGGDLSAMLRAAHTLKGAAQVVGESAIARGAHDLEEVLGRWREAPSPALSAEALHLVDGLAGLLRAAFAGPEPAAQAPLAEDNPKEAVAGREPEPAAAVFIPEPPHQPPEIPSEPEARTIRVDLRESDRLLHHLHEATAVAAGMRDLLTAREASAAEVSPAIAAYREALRDRLDWLDREFEDLYRTASRMRLVAVDALLLEAGRIARTAARTLGKEVRCVTRSEADRLDLHVLEALEDALLHLIRNALAHGIETPGERLRAGKPAAGVVTVELLRQGSNVVLRCADDGRGIDREAVRRVVVARGLLPEAQARQASEQELFSLMLRSGFSTRGAADAVSGRGIGLDVVVQAASRLGGSVAIESAAGRGATFTVTVPQTVFATEVLNCSVGGVRYAFPIGGVEQTLLPDAHLTVHGQGASSLLVDGVAMSYAGLTDVLPSLSSLESSGQAVRQHEDRRRQRVGLRLRSGGRRAVLGVEEIHEIAPALIRPLPAYLHAHPMIAGAILGPTGDPQLVLDVAETIAHILAVTSRKTPVQPAARPVRLPVLVVDDSLTTRMLERSILEAEGYLVELATSAEQAWEMVQRKPYALLLVDVEMPGMNGFEFVSKVKADPVLNATPAIMVTSLDSMAHRERGRLAGAYSYIVKGEFNQRVYLDRIRTAVGDRA